MRKGILVGLVKEAPTRARNGIFVGGGLLLGAALLLSSCGGGGSGGGGGTQAQINPVPTSVPSGGPDPIDPQYPRDPENLESRVLTALAFQKNGKSYAAIDIDSYHLEYKFDSANEKTTGRATVKFRATKEGQPFFFLTPSLNSATLDGKSVSTTTVKDPDGVNTYRTLEASLPAGSAHEMVIDFTLASSETTYRTNGVGFLLSFTDVTGWKFLNRYGVGNFEADQFQLTWDMELDQASTAQKIYTNGQVTELEPGRKWRTTYPAYYTSSSFFMHFSSDTFSVARLTYTGKTKTVPILLYSKTGSLVTDAKAQILNLFKELEEDYGPYAHDQFTAYLSGSSGGMEYVGATITSVPSLDHELLHSWFARGVMPSQGRTGWFDEAVASWRDYGYFQSKPTLTRTATNLASYSIYQANTPSNAYTSGRQLMSELDVMFKDYGGYKKVLREFFAAHQKQVITTELYLDFIQARTKTDLAPYFSRYVYGSTSSSSKDTNNATDFDSQWSDIDETMLRPPMDPGPGAGHPTPLTMDEELMLR